MITSEMMDEALIKMRDEINNEIVPKANDISAEIKKVVSDERLQFMQDCINRYGKGERGDMLLIHCGEDKAYVERNAKLCYHRFSILGLSYAKIDDFIGEGYDYGHELYIGIKYARNFSSEQAFLNFKYERLMRCAKRVKEARDLISSVDDWLPSFLKEFEEWYNDIVSIDLEETSKFNEMFGTSPSIGKIKVEVKVYNFDGNEE